MMTDPIADFLTQIKNGYLARKEKIVVPVSKEKQALAKVFSQAGYLGKVEVEKKTGSRVFLEIELLYQKKKPRMTEIKRISKPGRRIYVGWREIPKILGGLGEVVVSTSSGIMLGKEARKKHLGGELICQFW